MRITNLKNCPEFIAGDNCILRELLHAGKGDYAFRYSLAQAKVKSGKTTFAHKLKTSEVYYILKGRGRMCINNESAAVKRGDAIYIPPMASQYIQNTGKSDLVFLCIVDPAWRVQDEEVVKT